MMILPIGSKSNPSRTSFTLLELLLVIFIISLFLGLAFPRIKNSIEGFARRSFIRRAYLFLDHARAQSTLRRKPLAVELDTGALRLKGTEEDAEAIDSLAVPLDIDLRLDEERAVFYPDGTLEEFSLYVCDARKRCSLISAGAQDGKITISDEAETGDITF